MPAHEPDTDATPDTELDRAPAPGPEPERAPEPGSVPDPQPDPAPFTALARVYDSIMADIEYDEWVSFVLQAAAEQGFAGGRVLDLGCGTGNATRPLVGLGLQVEGLDGSEEMLAVARRKLPGVTFHRGDFTSFELPGRYALVYSVFDSLNNLLTDEAFLAMARRVRAHLEPGGVFVFDVNTPVGLRGLWEGGVAAGLADDVYYRWEHSFDEATGLARVEAYCDTPQGAFTEVHHERGYDADAVRRLLSAAGLEVVEVSRHPDGGAPGPYAERLWVVARAPTAAPG